MNINNAYREEQKYNYMVMMNETDSFEQAYTIAAQKGELDILEELIDAVDKRAEFISEMWLFSVEDKNQKFDFLSKIGIQELKKRYSPELGQKIERLKNQDKLTETDIIMLVDMNEGISETGRSLEEVKLLKQSQAEKISYLLDIFTDPNIEVGIHRTGGAVSGEKIKEEGLYLTGDISSGCVNNIEKQDIKTVLEKNVSFFPPRAPGMAIAQICKGANYKNLANIGQVDIMLISIPKNDLGDKSLAEEFVKYNQGQPTLDPKYVLGYVTVDKKDKIINQIQADYVPTATIETNYALEQLKEGTLGVTKDPEYGSIKNKFFRILEKIMGKDKSDKKTTKEDIDQYR